MGTPFQSLFLFLFLFHTSSCSPIPYTPHCAHIVPKTTRSDPHTNLPPRFLRLYNSHLSPNAHQLLPLAPPSSLLSLHFTSLSVFRTLTPHILDIDATLQFTAVTFRNSTPTRSLYRLYSNAPPFRLSFRLTGSWSSSSDRLCMVGSTRLNSNSNSTSINVVFKLNYPNHSTISTSLVTGTLESLDASFTPISVLGLSRMNYDYSLVDSHHHPVASRDSNQDCRDLISLSRRFQLRCVGINCTLPHLPFAVSSPVFMSMSVIDCSTHPFVRFAFQFSNSSYIYNGIELPFDPVNALVAEGVWSEDRNRISFVACRVLMEKSSIGDCSVRLDITLASVLSIRSTSLIDGQMRSNKSVGDVGYFDAIEIRASEPRLRPLLGMGYEYTEIDRASRYCSEDEAAKSKGTDYPDPYSSDMSFDMAVKDDNKQIAGGIAIPVFVDGQLLLDGYRYYRYPTTTRHLGTLTHGGLVNRTHGDLVNITYTVILNPTFENKLGGKSTLKKRIDISAEGTYDTKTGLLCMVGCWAREVDANPLFNVSTPVDCELFIRVQFPHRMNGVVKGTIESKRQTTDPQYFKQLSLTETSITGLQAESFIWRMDFEIAMVLVSNTLACVFLGLQLLHVKNRPEVLPFISVVMLVVLTLGHMVPLLLNFDALLSSRKRQNVLFGTGDWLQMNEIIVRAITMIAFLLEARLLQLAWSSRTGNENRNILWSTEKKVAYLSIPICVVAALIAWFLHPWKILHKTSFSRLRYKRVSRWHDLKAFAGLVLDAFLFPQIIFNIFCDSKENSLATPYYVGTTIVRLLPHAYDLFRAHGSALKLDLWYIYANPRMNFYFTSWDIIISCCGMLYAIVIYLQQRLGGRWVIPSRLRESFAYEKVPVAVADTK